MLNSNHQVYSRNVLTALLSGDEKNVGQLFDDLLDSGASIQELYVHLITSVQCSIGELWLNGDVSIAQEHRATQILTDQLARIRLRSASRKSLGLRAVICSLEGDFHSLGGRMVSDLLINDGWEVHFLGANTPDQELINYSKKVNANLVGISVSNSSFVVKVRETVDKIKKEIPEVKTIVGGRGIMKQDDSMQIGADAVVTNPADSVIEARKVVGANSNHNGLSQILAEIGGRIHYYRKAQKMSQEKLAQSSGLDRAYISSVENGKQNITIGALLKLSDALGIDLSNLVVGNPQ